MSFLIDKTFIIKCVNYWFLRFENMLIELWLKLDRCGGVLKRLEIAFDLILVFRCILFIYALRFVKVINESQTSWIWRSSNILWRLDLFHFYTLVPVNFWVSFNEKVSFNKLPRKCWMDNIYFCFLLKGWILGRVSKLSSLSNLIFKSFLCSKPVNRVWESGFWEVDDRGFRKKFWV